MKLKFEIDYEGLKKYLESLNRSDIETNWNKPEYPKLKEAHAMNDIDFFKLHGKYPEETIVDYGTPFLLDAIGNDLSIVILSRRRYKLPTGRVIGAKFIKTIIDDCRKQYGTALNGYWVIPSQFIKPLTPQP